jgi:CheY-like chemotaxis protein
MSYAPKNDAHRAISPPVAKPRRGPASGARLDGAKDKTGNSDVKKITAVAGYGNKAEQGDHWSKGSRRQPTERPAPRVDAPLNGKGTVLVVDDEPLTRGVLARLLRQFGYRVLEATGALEAQHLADARRRIDLLLMDLSTHETSDLELALWFRAIHPRTKVLAASDTLWDINYEIGESQQIAFLAKPFTPRELARIVQRILE